MTLLRCWKMADIRGCLIIFKRSFLNKSQAILVTPYEYLNKEIEKLRPISSFFIQFTVLRDNYFIFASDKVVDILNKLKEQKQIIEQHEKPESSLIAQGVKKRGRPKFIRKAV